jgi:hypothetical protein
MRFLELIAVWDEQWKESGDIQWKIGLPWKKKKGGSNLLPPFWLRLSFEARTSP